MLKLIEEVSIEAPPGVVLDVIADVGSYERWNPWIIRAAGNAIEGNEIKVVSRLGNRHIKVRHRILRRSGREFRWCDLGWFTRLAYGERARFVDPTADGGAAYRVELTITGIGSRLVKAMLGSALADGLR